MNASWMKYLPEFLRKRLEGRPQFQNIIGNSGWLIADRIFRMGIGLLVSIWVTRYLGPERYGILSYATAFVSLISSIALLGLDSITVRNLVREPSRRDEILGSCFFLKLIGGAVAFTITIASIWLIRPSDYLSHQLVAITAIGTLFQMFCTPDFWFQSQVKAKYSVYARSAANIIICLVKIILIMLNAPLVAFAWAGVAEIALGSMGLLIAYRVNGHHLFAWRATRAMATELLRDSWPIFFSEIVMLIYLRVDRIMIGEINGNLELGIYSVAAMLAEAFYFIPLAVTSSVFPSIVEAKAVSEEFFHARLQQYYNLMALLAYVVAIPVTFLAGWLVPLMFGAVYSKAGPMFVGLIWAGLFYNIMVARSYYLVAMNWTRLHFITDFLGCVLNVALNLFLIPRYGGMGAVVASIISYWFVAHGSCFVFKPLFKTGNMLTKAMLYPKIW
jgi:O-antigen/teichoic acid export membrane protein